MAVPTPKRRRVSPRAHQLRKVSARRRYLRKHHPFPRLNFDAAWQAGIDALVEIYWRAHGRGKFSMAANGRCEFLLPDGRLYQTKLRIHQRQTALPWYEGFVACGQAPHLSNDERLNADGALPEARPAPCNLWPLQLKLSPAKAGKDERARYVGLMWVGAHDGRPGGEL